MTHADRDGASWRTMQRMREADIAFLAELRAADLDRLCEMHLNHLGKKAPAWKKVAIARAIARLEAKR